MKIITLFAGSFASKKRRRREEGVKESFGIIVPEPGNS